MRFKFARPASLTESSSNAVVRTENGTTRRTFVKGIVLGGGLALAAHLVPPLPGLRTILPGAENVEATPCPPCGQDCCNCAVFWSWGKRCTDTASCDYDLECALQFPGKWERMVWTRKYLPTEGDHGCCHDGCDFPRCCYNFRICGGWLYYFCCDPDDCPSGC